MNKEARARLWLQKVTLRGIEGLIADAYLKESLESSTLVEKLENYLEAKNMAEQVYAQCLGFGL